MSLQPNLKRVLNPPNPYHGTYAEWIDAAPTAELVIYEETAKSIVSHNTSPDIGFSSSVNPYRGCFHGCAYCYARPTHQYLDFGAGSDFERKIVVKINAPQLLKKEFEKKSWSGDEIVFSGVTDCYQPLEATYELTRQCLQICAEYQNSVSIITKGALIRRDIDILIQLKRRASIAVYMSIAFADDKTSKLIEPFAPRPSVRFRAMKELTEAGIFVGVGIAPVIPGLSDFQIPEILERASEAGARSAFMTLLRLPAEVNEIFRTRLEDAFPSKAKKILNQIKAMKGGKLNRSEWGTRMQGEGEQWEAIKFLFTRNCDRFGLRHRTNKHDSKGDNNGHTTFKRPTLQLNLFD